MSAAGILPLCQTVILLSWFWKSKSISWVLWTTSSSCLMSSTITAEVIWACTLSTSVLFPSEGNPGTQAREKSHCIPIYPEMGVNWTTVFLSHKPLYAYNLEPKHCHQGSRAPPKSTLAPAVSTIGPALCQNPLTNCHWWLTPNLANTKSTTHTKEQRDNSCHKRLMSHFLLMSLPSPFSY